MGFYMAPLKTHAPCHKIYRQGLKTHPICNDKARSHLTKKQKPLKTHAPVQKISEKTPAHTQMLTPGRPSDKDNGLHAPTQLRLARTHGTHDTHETKTKTKRSRSPGYGGRTSRTNSP